MIGQKHITTNSWREENGKYAYWIFGIFALSLLLQLLIAVFNEYSLLNLISPTFIIANLNLLVIPFTAINTVYFCKAKYHTRARSLTQLLLLKCMALILGVVLGTAITEYISYLLGVVDDDYINLGNYTLSASATNFVENCILALMIGLPVFYKESLHEKMSIRLWEKEKELEKVYQLKTKSELEAIHAKINPHFLYNALNSIVSLIHEDPDKAEQMVFSLSDLFRYSISSGDSNYASIKEEIYLVRTYLEIEHVRFQDQLQFTIEVDEKLNDILIPKFLIQPLIENAIKHGTSNISHGEIKLNIFRENQDLCISVYDNGPDFPKEFNAGYGLQSTVDKLELLYKEDYEFQLLNKEEKHLRIILKNIFKNEKHA